MLEPAANDHKPGMNSDRALKEEVLLHEIVIVGGGAAGLELATGLGNTLARRKGARITLVDKARAHLWKPLLHSVAAGSLDFDEHALDYLAQAHWHHFSYRYGELIGLDRERKQIQLAPTYDEEGVEITPQRSLHYDTLVIAIGSITNDFGTPGVSQHAIPLETPEQAVRFNHRLVNACIRADAQPDPVRPGQLHVVIVGAGATGTELAAELHRTTREVVAFGLDRIDPEKDIHITLIEAADRVLPALPPRISDATTQLLKSLRVDIRTNSKAIEIRADGVQLADGGFIPSELVIWSAGVKGPDVLSLLDGLETNRISQLVVTPNSSDHSRSRYFCDRRLRGLPSARRRWRRSAAGSGRPSRGVASCQATSSAAEGRTAESIRLSRFRLTCFARSAQYRRKSDGISRREEFLHRRLLRAFDVSFALQIA